MNASPERVVLWPAFVTLSLLSACQFAPDHVRPDPPISPDYPAEYTEEEAKARASALGWRDFFVDPRLRALIGQALERNRDLAIAVQQIEETRGLYRLQRADQLPSIGLSASATRTGGLGFAQGGAGVGGASGTAGLEEVYTVGVGLSVFELDFWGRVRNLTAAARAEYLSTVTAMRAFRLTLIREVAFAYLTSLEATERIRLAEATVDSRTEETRIARRRFDAGVTSETDLRQAETLLTQAETQLAELRLVRAQSENLLQVLVGGPTDESLPPTVPLADQTNLQPLTTGTPSDLLLYRPDIISAESRLRGARANIGAARAAFFPTISLTGQYGYSSPDLDALVGPNRRSWTYGPSLDLPIFDFGRRRANLDVATARERSAAAEYERTIQTAFQEVSDALAGRRFLAEQVAAQERGLAAQRRLAELARTRYRGGVTTYLEVLDAERNLFSTEQTLLQLRRAQAANLVSLYVALGGGVLDGGG